MDNTESTYREIAIPVSTFGTLRKELAKEVGALLTIHALHAAGYAAGSAAADVFRSGAGGQVDTLGEDEFWTRLAAFFSRRGWGSLTRSTEHRAVGILSSEDWVESADTEPGADGSCSFSTGFLSGILSGLAGGPLAVLEVSCRGRGDARCSFAFGSESAVHELYGQLSEGHDLEQSLAAF